MDTEKEVELRSLVCELCRLFYQLGWAVGTGGSVSIRHGDLAVMTPSGLHKERMKPEDLFVVDMEGKAVVSPSSPAKLSDSTVLFLLAYKLRGAGAVLHSHGMACNMATLLCQGSAFVMRRQEMIKGLDGHGFFDDLVIPIIDNTAWEYELAPAMEAAMSTHPKSSAVLVRGHGLYVWGKTWEQAKRHCECLHYLFEAFVQAHQLGISRQVTVPRPKHTHLLLDIEGTTTPISFVKDVLFPFSKREMRSYLERHWDDEAVQKLVQELAEAAAVDSAPAPRIDQPPTVDSVAAYGSYIVDIDRKLGPLKTLQGFIWDEGYASGELKGQVFVDAAQQIAFFVSLGVKVCIYSSGSRQAQYALFRHSDRGDLSRYLSCYFDTKVGTKQQSSSYAEILLSLGVPACQVLFVTDVLGEAKAAAAAGMDAAISLRDGNAPITEDHHFPCIRSFHELDV